MHWKSLPVLLSGLLGLAPAHGQQILRIFTWDGYVTAEDLAAVNRLLDERQIDVRAEVIQPYAEGPEQMFDILRAGKVDLSFLTLNYIQMQDGRIASLLQPIETAKLSRYGPLIPMLRRIPMGLGQDGRPLYLPFGGGAYGIWANRRVLGPKELPTRLDDLLAPRWKGKLALTDGQVQPNVALAFMAQGEEPFKLNAMVRAGLRREAIRESAGSGQPQQFLNALYAQVGEFWSTAPSFKPGLELVASYGVEIAGRRALGEDWQLVNFAEGNTVWMDTMNLAKTVGGAKREAAYVFMDYFLSETVQNRVVNGLSMVAVVSTVRNPLLDDNPGFFAESHFWPPYERQADNLMRAMSEAAMRAREP
ncbi:MAG: extracellular solute-binding protein [Gammaproteobacteria bacterium]|nr:extracellular solute-binding protein [Gammaproteobacteria bacterium]